jgi:hypothetical protein
MRVGFHNTEGRHTMTGEHRKILALRTSVGPVVRTCYRKIPQSREG